jgi:hypothetical protein
VQHFKAFEETPEDVHESIASYSEAMSNEGVIDIPEENKTPAGV